MHQALYDYLLLFSCVQLFTIPQTTACHTSCPSLFPGVCSNSCPWSRGLFHRIVTQDVNPPLACYAMLSLYSYAPMKPRTVLWVLGIPRQHSAKVVGLPTAPDASPGSSSVQPGLPNTFWVLRPQSIWVFSTWKTTSYISSLKLNCECLGGSPTWGDFTKGYYVGIWVSQSVAITATAIFSFPEKVWQELFFFFSFPLQCWNWPLSGITWPGWAGDFQNE